MWRRFHNTEPTAIDDFITIKNIKNLELGIDEYNIVQAYIPDEGDNTIIDHVIQLVLLHHTLDDLKTMSKFADYMERKMDELIKDAICISVLKTINARVCLI